MAVVNDRQGPYPRPADLPYYTTPEACREAFPEAPSLNPKFPELRHVFWTAGDMDDLRLAFERVGTPEEARKVVEFIFRRYRIGFYVALVETESPEPDLWFVPFENVEFENPYAQYLRLDPRFDPSGLVRDAARRGVHMEFEPNPKRWRLANFLVRMETWDDSRAPKNSRGEAERSYSFYYYETYCLFRNLADWIRDHLSDSSGKSGWGRRDLVVSYRDQLLVMENSCDPMIHVVGNDRTPLPEQPFPSADLMRYCPVLSFSGHPKYLDRAVITPDDICQVLKVYVPPECQSKFQSEGSSGGLPWSDREPRAVFRGTATGAGMDTRTNPRLHLASLARKLGRWMDVGVVGIPKRFKKVQWERWVLRNPTFEDLTRYGVRYTRRMTQEEQNRFRYQIYVEGNVAAYRLGKMLGTGSLVLKVESEYTLWLDQYLQPWVHYVPVRADLSDLVDRIEWCRRNDRQAQGIAEAARQVYDRIMTPEFMGRWMAETLGLADKKKE
jgi:hypothetical protein